MNSPEKLSSAGTTPNKQVRGADRPSDHRGCPPEQPWLKVRTGVAKSPCKCGSHAGIYMGFFAANMERKLRLLFAPEYGWALDSILTSANWSFFRDFQMFQPFSRP